MREDHEDLKDKSMIRQDRVLSDIEYQQLVGEQRVFPPNTRPGGVTIIDPGHTIQPPLKPDAVYQPSHYTRRKMQAIEYIGANKLEFWEANVVKYMARFDAKDGLQDLYKARSYLDMKIRELEGHVRWWEKPVAEERKLNAR